MNRRLNVGIVILILAVCRSITELNNIRFFGASTTSILDIHVTSKHQNSKSAWEICLSSPIIVPLQLHTFLKKTILPSKIIAMAETCRILVMASGNGSNFQAVLDAVASGRIPSSRVTRLIVNRQKAYAVKRAEQHSIPWDYFNLISNGFQQKGESDPQKIQEARDKYDAALARKVLDDDPEARPHLIVLAGWMYVFGEHFLAPVSAEGIKIINLHPALPG
jgi:formyltetrahydrofolate hydrolase